MSWLGLPFSKVKYVFDLLGVNDPTTNLFIVQIGHALFFFSISADEAAHIDYLFQHCAEEPAWAWVPEAVRTQWQQKFALKDLTQGFNPLECFDCSDSDADLDATSAALTAAVLSHATAADMVQVRCELVPSLKDQGS